MSDTKNTSLPNIVALDGATLNPGDLSWKAISAIGHFSVYDYTAPEDIVTRAKTADVILVNKVLIDAGLIKQLPRLKCICVTATGYNNVDLNAAAARNIPVCNAVGYSTDAVAQHVFALLLMMTNQAERHDKSVKQGDWSTQPHFSYTLNTIPEIAGKVMGIYGFGRIGRKVAQIAQAFGMSVLSTHKHPQRDAREGVSFVDLADLFSESDVISLHAPLSKSNEGIVNSHLLGRMKAGAYLINTGRGGLINELDLREALLQNRLAGAALDVLRQEPPKAGHPLIGLPNCWITPHVAWASFEARQRLMAITVQNINAFLKGSPQNVVNQLTG
jgi:glycerate dehydrogenase